MTFCFSQQLYQEIRLRGGGGGGMSVVFVYTIGTRSSDLFDSSWCKSEHEHWSFVEL